MGYHKSGLGKNMCFRENTMFKRLNSLNMFKQLMPTPIFIILSNCLINLR